MREPDESSAKGKAIALIPVKDDALTNDLLLRPINGKSALQRAINYARYIRDNELIDLTIAIVSSSQSILTACEDQTDILAPRRATENLQGALSEALEQAESITKKTFETALIIEPPHPWRPLGLASRMFEMIEARGSYIDSVVCATQLYGRIWTSDPGRQPIASSLCDDFYGDDAPYQEVVGLLLITKSENIRAGRRLGDEVGLVVVEPHWGFCDIRDEFSFRIARDLAFLEQPHEPGS